MIYAWDFGAALNRKWSGDRRLRAPGELRSRTCTIFPGAGQERAATAQGSGAPWGWSRWSSTGRPISVLIHRREVREAKRNSQRREIFKVPFEGSTYVIICPARRLSSSRRRRTSTISRAASQVRMEIDLETPESRVSGLRSQVSGHLRFFQLRNTYSSQNCGGVLVQSGWLVKPHLFFGKVCPKLYGPRLHSVQLHTQLQCTHDDVFFALGSLTVGAF
ncbi:hypothetical protein OF83DRAFT_453996 [Amylostereum chailletii]|nr:hypothetical protein OF83DRAFT_453996 [Amylostereum chailletii]